VRAYIGTSGYSYLPWRGRFYPRGLPPAQMLRFYSERFAAVELNCTFYALPKPAACRGWSNATPAGFRFAAKVPGLITHRKRLSKVAGDCARFIAALSGIRSKRGPVLLQLPPNLPKDLPRLADGLACWPKGVRLAVEFRHESWFDDAVYAALRAAGAAACIADSDQLDARVVATAGWGYLRLRRLDYTRAQLAAWAERIQEQGWDEVYAFTRHEDQARGVGFAMALQELLAGRRRA
jgi:uncharacterized protein YecE (DUF72 family)